MNRLNESFGYSITELAIPQQSALDILSVSREKEVSLKKELNGS